VDIIEKAYDPWYTAAVPFTCFPYGLYYSGIKWSIGYFIWEGGRESYDKK
jgi:hypothetical protein